MGKGGGGTDLHSRQLPEGNHPQPRGILSHTCGSKKYLYIFLNFLMTVLFWQKKQPSTTQRDISTHFWLKKCKYFNLNFPRIFWVEKKTALCCPQTRGTLRKQYCIVLHIVKQGVPSCLHSCDNVATRCVSGSLSSIWVNCYCWGNSSMVEGRFSKWF